MAKKSKETRPVGRPSDYSLEIAEKICEELIKPRFLSDICNDEGMPHRITVHRWLSKHMEFRNMYTLAREIQVEALVDEIFKIADDSSNDDTEDQFGNIRANTEWISRSRLRVDTRKWYASKVYSKVYGQKPAITIVNSGDTVDPLLEALESQAEEVWAEENPDA